MNTTNNYFPKSRYAKRKLVFDYNIIVRAIYNIPSVCWFDIDSCMVAEYIRNKCYDDTLSGSLQE